MKNTMEQETVTYTIEMTDTFGGEANYSWVKRRELKGSVNLTERQIIRRLKSLLGVSSVPHRKTVYGDQIRLDFSGCVVAFIDCYA